MTEPVAHLNGTIWVFAFILIAFVIIQAAVFLKMALKFNKENKILSDQEVNMAVKTGILSVIGPACSVVVIAISLMTLLGPAITFMRVGVIGSASTELTLANIAADAMGGVLGEASFDEVMISAAIFGMVLGSAPYFLNCFLTLKPLDAAVGKSKSSGKDSFALILGFAASIGLYGRYVLVNGTKGGPTLVAVIAGGLVTYLLKKYIKKSGKKGLNSWTLAIALLAGMICAMIAKSIIG